MNRVIIPITSQEQWHQLRAGVLTSTDCATLFNLSPYQTIFELWHRKKDGLIVSFDENQRMKWGNRLESAIAFGVAEENNWVVSSMKDFYIIDGLRLGSSFDFFIQDREAILEIKNVDGLIYRNNWDEDEAPYHIELQVQFQMLVSGYKRAYICALVGGNELKLIERTADEDIQQEILRRAADFWKSIEDNIEPKPDYEKDAEYIIKLNQFAEPNKIYAGDLTELADISMKYNDISKQIEDLKTKKEGLKARIFEIMGDAEKVRDRKFSISAGVTGPSEVSYTRSSFRNIRVTIKKDGLQ